MTSLCKLGKQPQAAETGPKQVASHVEIPGLSPSFHSSGTRRGRICMVRVQEVAQNQVRILGPTLFGLNCIPPKDILKS